MKLRPLGDRVVLQALKEDKVKGGIILPETVDKDRPEQGKVVYVGPGRMEDGKLVPPGVKKGDTVIFSKYGPSEVKLGDKEYLIAREEDILAVVEK